MIYLIGGPPKCGKTTLSKTMFKKHRIPWISCDALQTIAHTFTPSNERAKKFPWSVLRKKTNRVNDVLYDNYHWRDIIKLYRTPAKLVCKAVDAFIAAELAEQHDYIIEGHALEPKFVRNLQNKYGKKHIKAVFLIKHDEQEFVKNIKKSKTKSDWIIRRTKDPARIYPKIAKMICEHGKIIERNAKKHGFKVIKTDINFQEKLNQAMKYFVK